MRLSAAQHSRGTEREREGQCPAQLSRQGRPVRPARPLCADPAEEITRKQQAHCVNVPCREPGTRRPTRTLNSRPLLPSSSVLSSPRVLASSLHPRVPVGHRFGGPPPVRVARQQGPNPRRRGRLVPLCSHKAACCCCCWCLLLH